AARVPRRFRLSKTSRLGSPVVPLLHIIVFFFNDTATTEIYPLSLHAALPICARHSLQPVDLRDFALLDNPGLVFGVQLRDRKSTRLNSSHVKISYAVFCL